MPSERSPGLPVRAMEGAIAEHLQRDRRLVLVAETGSGKTTQVPQILFERSLCGDGTIIVLQPRRLAARAVARRVAAEMGESLGGLVGFRTRHERSDSKDTRILFMTDGLFVRMAQSNQTLEGVGAVVMDEFHERTLATDLAWGIVRRLQTVARPDLFGIVMSATIDSARLTGLLGCEALEVEGRLHPVAIRHLADSRPGDDHCVRAADATVEAVRAVSGDALVFMPGRREIGLTIDALASRLGSSEFDLLALHGSQRAEEQDRALSPSGRRKIVVATNIAETSLTIPGVTIVVDSGLARIHRFDQRRDLNALTLEPISQASARQRAGRAGRVAPGICVRLWSESAHGRRPEFDSPEIKRIDLSEALLTLAAMGESEARGFPWVDAPDPEAIARAQRVLVACGGFDPDGSITPMGRMMSRVPAHPRIARALIESARRGCLARASLWAAVISERDAAERADAEWLRSQLEAGDHSDDLVARERALSAFDSNPRGSMLDPDAARESLRVADDFARTVSRVSPRGPLGSTTSNPNSSGDDSTTRALAESFLLGFSDRVAWRLDRHRPHAAMGDRRKVSLDRRSLHEGEGPFMAFDVRQAGSGDSQHTTLSLTAALTREWVENALPKRFTRTVEERWEESSRSVEEVEETKFDATVIERTVRPPMDLVAASRVIASRMAEGSLVSDDWAESVLPWIARVRWVAKVFPERSLITYDADDLAVIFADVAAGASRWNQVSARPTRAALVAALSHEDRLFVEKMAPADIRLPSGLRMKLEYSPDQDPRGRAKIQDFYGLDATPRVGGGRAAVLLEILGPNHRPLQVTADLAGFWKTLYPQIRNDLRRRYPRHQWR